MIPLGEIGTRMRNILSGRWPLRALLGSHRYFPLGEGLGLVRLNSGRFIYVDPLEESVCPFLIAYGEWEYDTSCVILGLLDKGDHVLEVGAHVGFHTLAMAHRVGRSGRVTSLEANPRLAALARRSLRFNRYDDRVQIIQKAASDTSGTVRFTTSRTVGGGGHIYGGGLLGPDTEVIDVDSVRLDDLDAGSPKLIRLDAEGSEGLILRGSERLLERPDVILCMEWDIIQMRPRTDPQEVATSLSSKGFRFWRIRPKSTLEALGLDDLMVLKTCDILVSRSRPVLRKVR